MQASRSAGRSRSVATAFRLATVLTLAAVMAGTVLAQEYGGRFVVGRSGAPSILDPQKTGESAADEVLSLVGGSLMTIDPDTLALGPGLADSVEQSADGLTFTFKIHPGVKYHNGDPLTAADFKYTYERALDPATEATVSGDMLAGVESVEAPDDYTLVVHLKEPSAVFLRNLSNSGYLQPLSRRAVEEAGADYGRAPVGVGPYRFKEWVAGYSITLERNPDFAWAPYYLKNQGAPYPDEIEFRYLPEQGTLVAALEAGEVDYADVPAVDLALFQDNPNFNVYSSLSSGIGLEFIFNLRDPIMADIRVRQAFNHAIDKQFFIDRVVDGHGIPATGVLPPSLPGYDPDSAATDYDFDREAAGALLDAAGWTMGPNGVRAKDGQPLTIRIVAYTVSQMVLASELLQNQLKAIGVDATVESYERSLQMPMIIEGDYQIAPLSWTYDDPDVLYFLAHSSQHPNGLNLGAVNDPELDRLLDVSRTTLVDSERMLVFHDIQRLMNENAYLAPVYVQETFSAANKRVEGLRFTAIGAPLLQEVWIAR